VERKFDWVAKAYGCSSIDFCGFDNYDVYAALSALGCPYLALLLTDFGPSDPLGKVVCSWKEWIVRYEWVRRGGAVKRRLRRLGFLVHAHHLFRPSDSDVQEELEEAALRGDAYAAAILALDRELELFFNQVEAGSPGAAELFDRCARVLSALGRGITVSFLEWEFPEEKLREWAEVGTVERIDVLVRVHFSDPELVPEELKLVYFKDRIRPVLQGLARVLAPAYFSRVNGILHVSIH